MDPSPTRHRKGGSTGGVGLGGHTEVPRGLFGKVWYYIKQIFSILLFHNPESLEEPVEGSSAAGIGFGGELREGRHAKQLRSAMESLDQAAQAGNDDAIFLSAQMNFFGNWSHPRNYKRAFEMYKKLADKNGNSTAQYMMGFLYATGFGGAVERDQAKVWWCACCLHCESMAGY